MNEDATMNENAFKYKGMDRFECREALLKDLEKENLLISIERWFTVLVIVKELMLL